MAGLALAPPAHATLKYGPIELSGSVDSQNLFRTTQIDEWQFIQNRNTALIRLDYNWLQHGKFVDRYNLPFIKESKLYLLYRGTYDGFWGIAPGGRQKGVTVYDDMVGGPIIGNTYGATTTNCPAGGPNPCPVRGLYSSLNSEGRNSLAWTNTLREAYVDLSLADAPVSFRIGRQQVIWGESDQFRLMDIINPLDTTWHLQQEDWDKIRIPLWMFKGIWDMGDVGPISNAFTEVVWDPDFAAGNKVQFLPAPWAIPIPNPTRSGQIDFPSPQLVNLLTPVFNFQGTSVRQGDFHNSPGQASAIGVRVHGVTDIPLLHMQSFEFTANYYYGRSRAIGAVAGAPFVLRINQIVIPDRLTRATSFKQGSPSASCFGAQSTGDPALFAGQLVYPACTTAEWVHPYSNIVGTTANYFEGNYTNAVFRLEMAYQFGAPLQSAFLKDRIPVYACPTGVSPPNPACVQQPQLSPLGTTSRDIWAGMIGFDRPTWIRFLNPRTTWFITGQFFWSYINGTWSKLRGGIETAGAFPYIAPPASNTALNKNLVNGVGQWDNGPFAGQIERTQSACNGPSCGQFNTDNGNADRMLQWEMLTTLAATSFYFGGTLVPFIAIAIDPMNRNFLAQLKCDYFLTNDLILQGRVNFYNDLGSGTPSLDPWGAGGLNARRDEVGFKLTYQF
jgi:hypothetical protein